MTDLESRQRQVRRRILIAGGAAVAAGLGLGYWKNARVPAMGQKTISAAKAHADALAGDILLVDIRTPEEWRATGIGEGAVPIDMQRDDFLEALAAAGGARDSRIALICRSGNRSARLAKQLQETGFTGVIDVSGGMQGSAAAPGWAASGLPVVQWDG